MRISKLLMPAVTLAGALALAGCGGGSSTPTTTAPGGEGNCPFGKKMGSDDCYTEAEYRAKVKAEAEKEAEEERKDKETAEAAQKRAEALSGFLTGTGDTVPPLAQLAPESGSNAAINALLADARKASDGLASKDKAHVQVRLVEGTASDAPGTATQVAALNAGTITGTGFATGSNQRVDHDGTTGANKGPRRIAGNFNGASGIYSCTGPCFSQRTASGISLTGSWTFIANPGQKYNAMTFAEYGWWLNEEAGSSAPKSGAWYALADGMELNAAAAELGTDNTINLATGSATYKGDAIGQAAFYDSTTSEENIGGAFAADAELTATFTSGTGGDMLEGKITNFRIGAETQEWEVKLLKHSLTDGGAVNLTNPSRTQWNIGTGDDTIEGSDDGGAWEAQLHSIPDGGHQPDGVVGTFRAEHGSEGRMVGAFGASQ